MILVPAIDVSGGDCVRLELGDFARVTSYSSDALGALVNFAASGAQEVHIVDLDGARDAQPRQHDLLSRLAASSPIDLQVAGGFRTVGQVAAMLKAGAQRVVIGSLASQDPAVLDNMLAEFGADRLTLSLDVKLESGQAMVATNGWARTSDQTLYDLLKDFPAIRHVLVTDISRDGMLAGPNAELMQSVLEQAPTIELQASGGVASLSDLDLLRNAGASRAIVGKAIWEQRFSVAEGVERARG